MALMTELKRRNVFRVGAAYAIVGWLLLEVASVILPALHLPNWALTLLVVFVVAGFPLALILAWAFEMTPEGLKRDAEVDRTESVRHSTGRKLDFAIIGLLAVALIYVVMDNYILKAEPKQAGMWSDLGYCYDKVGNRANAIDAYEHHLALVRTRERGPLALQGGTAVAATVLAVIALFLAPALGELSSLITGAREGWESLGTATAAVGLGSAAGWIARLVVFGP
jgi:hypothetical protein